MTERDALLSEYSDSYKDAHGFRPRGEWMRTATCEEFRAKLDALYASQDADRAYEQAEAAFEAALAANVAMGGEGWEYTPAGGAA